MIRPQFLIERLADHNVSFYVGVPDSLLKDLCAYLSDNIDARHNIITANEGGAIGLAAGHFLATQEIPVVYMQNSGEGNIINPMVSLMDKEVYNIPVLLLIGWRGCPGIHDEPQHIKQGKITIPLLDTLGIRNTIMAGSEQDVSVQIDDAIDYIRRTNEPYAFVVKKGTFDSYKQTAELLSPLAMGREEAIQKIASNIKGNDCVIASTGMISRELFEFRSSSGQSHERDFLTMGSMGHASQIALAVALEKTDRRVWCFDGDGAVIMHMGGMAIIASKHPQNFVHVVLNNGAHDSVGGQPTVGLEINLPTIAQAMGYRAVFSVESLQEITTALQKIEESNGPYFLEVKVKKGNRKDIGRPTTTPAENKKFFMEFLSR